MTLKQLIERLQALMASHPGAADAPVLMADDWAEVTDATYRDNAHGRPPRVVELW